MTLDEFTEQMLAMPEPLLTDVVTSFVAGVLLRSREENRLPDAITHALGAYGVALVVVDENGVKLYDAWSANTPRGEAVTALMHKLHDAITRTLDGAMERNGS